MKNGVIFLIESKIVNNQELSLLLEKETKCRVYNFFSIEETDIYNSLNPQLIISDKLNPQCNIQGLSIANEYSNLNNTSILQQSIAYRVKSLVN